MCIAIVALISALALMFVTACSGGASGNAGNAADDAKRTKFGGISFVLPDGWEASASGDKLEIKAPENKDVIAVMQGNHKKNSVPSGKEEAALDSYIGGVLKGIGANTSSINNANITMQTIDGKTSETAKLTMNLAGYSIDTYAFGVIVDDGITNLMLGSTDGAYNKEFEGIINSVKIA